MKLVRWLLAGFVLLTSACSYTHGATRMTGVGAATELQPGVSRAVDLHQWLGQPHDVRTIDEEHRVWVYYRVHSRTSAWTFVPIVGLVAGGSAKTETSVGYFVFNEEDVLIRIAGSDESQSYTNMWSEVGTAVQRHRNHAPRLRVEAEMTRLSLPYDDRLARRMAGFIE